MLTRKRARSRRRPRALRRNPLSTGQKGLIVGGVLAAGGVAAYALMSSPAAPVLPPPPSPADLAAAKAAECAALQAGLVQLRAQTSPDRASMLQLEAQISTCLSQAQELGLAIPPSTAHQAEGDAQYAQIEAWWNEYKTTSDHDPLKRNNTRQSILGGGAALAQMYADAITQSPNKETTRLIAQSIVRALDSAVTRQLCFLSNERGCGTFGVNEDQPDAKAAQEQSRVIVPLMNAYNQAVTKVGGPAQAIYWADGERYMTTMLRQCSFTKDYIDGQFAHYKGTDWSDALKRNNTRQTMLAAGRDLIACLQRNYAVATSYASTPTLRAIGTLTVAALNAAIDRWSCYFMSAQGCGTMAANEDQPDVKASQEMANTVSPLLSLYAQEARTLVSRGDAAAFEPLVTAKLRVCSTLKSYIDGQFGHYKATDWSDALKRNNTRQTMLAVGSSLATCLQEALATAISAKTATVQPKGVSGLLGVGGYTGQAGMGQFIQMLMPVNVASLAPVLAASLAKPDVPKMVRQVGTVAAGALDAAMLRKLCYLFDQPGCGRLGVNEDHGNDKAAQEQARVITPLIGTYKQIVANDPENAQVETPLMRSLLREIDANRNFIEAKYNEMKGVPYHDPLRRNNVRGEILNSGRNLLTLLRNTRPTTPAGRAMVRGSAQTALASSQSRALCYSNRQPGCDRSGDFEPEGMAKYNEEKTTISDPLAALIGDRSANGLGSLGDEPMSPAAWLGVAVVGGVLAYSVFSQISEPVRRNKKRRSSKRTSRRTSRRLAA